MKILLLLLGSMIVYSSVASGAAPLLGLAGSGADAWQSYGFLWAALRLVPQPSEPASLLLLGFGLALTAGQIRTRPR